MRRSIVLLVIMLSASSAQINAADFVQKVKLSGRITDARTGEPLPGAYVYFVDDKIGGSADANGYYEVAEIPSGHQVVEISHTGYANLVVHLELKSDTKMDFALTTVIAENQGVIVTGVSGATSIRKSTVPVASLRRQDMYQQISSNIVDALTRIPGVSQVSTGPAISKPVIRGLGYNRVVTVSDGVRQEGQQWGDEHGVEIDELSINRAEVLKGPASLMYGSDALAGVINFITHNPAPEGSLKANWLSEYESNNRMTAFHGDLSGNKKGLNWNVYGTFRSAADYRNKYDGVVLNSRFNEKNAGGYIGINKSWGFSHFIFSRFDQRIGMVEGERDPVSGRFILYGGTPLERVATDMDLGGRDQIFIPRQRVQHNKFVSDNNFVIGNSRLKINLAYQDNRRQEFGNPEEPKEKSLFFDLGTLNYNLIWQLPEKNEWHVSIGAGGMRQTNRNKGLEALIPEYNLFDAGAFVYVQRFFKDLTLSGGARFDNRSIRSFSLFDGTDYRFNAFQKGFSNLSGSFGLSYEPSKLLTFKWNIARGFRSPSLSELSSNGAHEGTNRYEYGEPDLKAETSLQTDGGFQLNHEHITVDLSVFYNRMQHFIYYRKLESVNGGDSLLQDAGNTFTAFRFHQQNAKLYGAELNVDLHPHPLDWLHFENTFSYVRGRFDATVDGSDNLPLIPAIRWINTLRGSFNNAGRSLRNLYVRLEADNTFRQSKPFTGFNTETATAGYTLLNAGAGSDVYKKKVLLFSVYLSVSNITNKSYQNHLSRLKYTDVNPVTGRMGVFNMGRDISLKINVPMDLKRKP